MHVDGMKIELSRQPRVSVSVSPTVPGGGIVPRLALLVDGHNVTVRITSARDGSAETLLTLEQAEVFFRKGMEAMAEVRKQLNLDKVVPGSGDPF